MQSFAVTVLKCQRGLSSHNTETKCLHLRISAYHEAPPHSIPGRHQNDVRHSLGLNRVFLSTSSSSQIKVNTATKGEEGNTASQWHKTPPRLYCRVTKAGEQQSFKIRYDNASILYYLFVTFCNGLITLSDSVLLGSSLDFDSSSPTINKNRRNPGIRLQYQHKFVGTSVCRYLRGDILAERGPRR